MRSVMTHQFSQVPNAEIQRSSFDRSHGYKTTFDAGYLVPVYLDEVLPGDTFNLRMSAFARLATPIKPVMDNIFLDSFFFAVPVRLIWDNWAKFNGEQVNPGDSTSFVVPQMTGPVAPGILVGSLSDYFGIPTGIPSLTFNSLWHRAYNLIYNTWFRDQNLQNSLVVDKDDGPDTYTDYVLKRRGKRHDYFTSSLPFPQKGTAVSLPLGSTAPLIGTGNYTIPGQNVTAHSATLGTGTAYTRSKVATDGGVAVLGGSAAATWFEYNPALAVPFTGIASGLTTDLSLAAGATINALRQAFQLQRMYERDARGGTRYTEIIKAHFGVTSPDARLQRPEYLGGGTSYVNIHPVAQTAEVFATTPQGNLAAFGTASFSGHGFSKSFTEHCVIIGMVSARADLTYQQGLNRMFSRRTRFDFYWPALSHLGEQSVLNQEIYAQGSVNPTADAAVFGYQERYAEYRYKPSMITGQFRSTYATSLDFWHLSEEYSALPTLSTTFIVVDPPIDRVIAVPSEPHFLFDSFISLRCARPMPVYGVPGMIDHF